MHVPNLIIAPGFFTALPTLIRLMGNAKFFKGFFASARFHVDLKCQIKDAHFKVAFVIGHWVTLLDFKCKFKCKRLNNHVLSRFVLLATHSSEQ